MESMLGLIHNVGNINKMGQILNIDVCNRIIPKKNIKVESAVHGKPVVEPRRFFALRTFHFIFQTKKEHNPNSMR